MGTNGTLNLTVNDLCGNTATGSLTVNVVDNIVPTMVCDEITQVTLTNDGTATVLAQVYDDGTFDNCCLAELSVRRLNANMVPTTPFGPSVTFGCADVGLSNMVELRATDCFGNFNTCMVETLVDDKSLVNIQCPTTTSVSCVSFLTIAAQLEALEDGTSVGEQAQLDLINSTFGFQSGLGTGIGALCGQNDDVSVSFSLTNCDDGATDGITITYTTTANNGASTATVDCFIPIDDVIDWDVTFPEDQTLFCTNTSGFTISTDPDDLAAQFGEPTFINNGCPQQLAYNESVEVFTSAPDACYKIVRTFTAINWCEAVAPFTDLGPVFLDGQGLAGGGQTFTYDAQVGANESTTNDNVIRYAQVIKVNDNIAPVIQEPVVAVTTAASPVTCDGIATLTRPAADDCVDDDDLSYAYAIVPVGGGTATVGVFSGLTATVTLPFGTYSVAYEVSDQCGNTSIVDGGTFVVADGKKPTPICMNGLVIEIMQTGMVPVNISMIDKGSFDNCSDVTLSFVPMDDPAFPDTTLILTCDQVGLVPVTLYVVDAAGNEDFCTTAVILQDNMGACGGDPLVLGGSLRTEAGAGVGNAQVEISGMSSNDQTTDASGTFQFTDLSAGGDFTITPSKDIGVRNGVSSLDLFLMTRHILGDQPLDSPYKVIAADINNSGEVTALDVAVGRMVILHLMDEFPNNTSWRFVDEDYDFINASMPLMEDFPEVFNVNNLTGGVLDADFIGIKVGDVNGNAVPDMLHGGLGTEDRFDGAELPFQTQDRSFRAGETFQVTLTAAETSDWLGAQGTLAFEHLELTNVLPHGDWTAADFGTAHADNQRLTFAHVVTGDVATLRADATLFTLEFRALANGTLAESLTLSEELTTNEGYDANGNRRVLTLDFLPQDDATDAFVLYQNRPNPFAEETVIAFHLPTQTEVTLRVFDAAGREILTRRADFDAGKQQFTVKGDELATKGMMLYRLESEHGSLLGKMVRE